MCLAMLLNDLNGAAARIHDSNLRRRRRGQRCGSCRTGCGSLFGGTLHLGLGSSVGCYCLQNGSLSMTRTTLGQIQIQIQIESLHTRLDETDEMTNTA